MFRHRKRLISSTFLSYFKKDWRDWWERKPKNIWRNSLPSLLSRVHKKLANCCHNNNHKRLSNSKSVKRRKLFKSKKKKFKISHWMIIFRHFPHKKSANLKCKILNFLKLSSCPKKKKKNISQEKITNFKMILNTHQPENLKTITMSILKKSLITNLSINTKNLSKLKKLKNSIKTTAIKSISVDTLLPFIFKIFYTFCFIFCATQEFIFFCKRLKKIQSILLVCFKVYKNVYNKNQSILSMNTGPGFFYINGDEETSCY